MKMKRQIEQSRKLGDKRNELAKKHRKDSRNFSQSRDVREDRGRMQSRFGHK